MRQYFSDSTDLSLGSAVIPEPHASADYTLSQLLTNNMIGPTVFAILSRLLPNVPRALLEFARDDLLLGKNTPILFPLLINLVPLTFAAIEIAIRDFAGVLGQKADNKVHTPFPKIMPFERKEAVFVLGVMTLLQVNNGILIAHPGFEGRVTDEVSKDFFSTSAATLYGQLLFAVTSLFLTTKVIVPAAKKVAPVVSAVCSSVSTGVSAGVSAVYSGAKSLAGSLFKKAGRFFSSADPEDKKGLLDPDTASIQQDKKPEAERPDAENGTQVFFSDNDRNEAASDSVALPSSPSLSPV